MLFFNLLVARELKFWLIAERLWNPRIQKVDAG